MAVRRIGTSRRAQERHGLPVGDLAREVGDGCGLPAHLREVPLPVLRPGDRWTALPVEIRQQLGTGSELLAPDVPRFLAFRQTAGPVTADEDAQSVGGTARVVPAARAQWHVSDDVSDLQFLQS